MITLACVYLDIQRQIAELVLPYFILFSVFIFHIFAITYSTFMFKPVSKWEELLAQPISITSNATKQRKVPQSYFLKA